MSIPGDGNGNVMLHRLRVIEKQIVKIETIADTAAGKVSVHEEQINGERGLSKAIAGLRVEVSKEMSDLRDEIKSLKRAIYGAAFTVVAGAVLMVLQLAGQGVPS